MLYKQSGAALISALFITMIAAMIATALLARQQMMIQQSQWVIRADQMTQDLQFVTYWAMAHVPSQATLNDTIIHGVTVRGTLEDAQSKFNLNELQDINKQIGFAKMIHHIDPQISIDQGMQLAQHLGDKLNQHQMISVHDLRDMPNVLPYVIVLPQSVPININTATAPVLLSANPILTDEQAEMIAACRQSIGEFSRVEDFEAACVTPQHFPVFSLITTQSQYDEVTEEAVLSNDTIKAHHLLWLQSNGLKNVVRIVW